MFNIYHIAALLILLFARLSHADTAPLEISRGNGGVLQFRNFDEKYGGWSDIKYKGATDEFNVYMVPSKMEVSEEGHRSQFKHRYGFPRQKICDGSTNKCRGGNRRRG